MVRGCCAGLVVLLLLVTAALVLLVRLTAAPDLGATPSGPDDGASPLAIGASLALQVGDQLAQPGATGAAVVVSEQDLSTLAAEDNPDPRTLAGLQVRARGDQLWVSADSHLGPLAVVVTARLSLGFQPGSPVTASIGEIWVGDQQIPGFLTSAVDPRADATFSLTPLLTGSELSQFGLECVTVVASRGVELGFHEPRASVSTGYCAAHPPTPDAGQPSSSGSG
jgi:hypothetical protein